MDWASLLQTLLLGDNQLRSQAEDAYNASKQQNPHEAIVQLAQVVHSHSDVSLQALAAVLLRGIILRETEVWQAIDAHTQTQVRRAMLDALASVSADSIRRKICDIIAVVAHHGEFPELLGVLAQLLQTDDAQSLGLYLVDRLAEYAPTVLAPALSDVTAVAAAGLASGQPAKVVAACNAVISMCYEILQSEEMVQTFLPLLRQVVQAVRDLMTPQLEEHAQEVLAKFRQFADKKEHMPLVNLVRDDLLPVLIQACGNRELDDVTCVISLDLLVHCVVTAGAAPVDKDFVTGLVDMLMQLMCLVDESSNQSFFNRPDNPAGFGDVDEYETEEVAGAAAVNMERVAQMLPVDLVAAAAMPRMAQFSASDSWQMRRAAHFTLALISEGCADEIFPVLHSVVPHVANSVTDPHPRVRYASLHSLSQLITDFAEEEDVEEGVPTFSVRFGASIIEKVHSILSENAQYPRVLAMALYALTRLCRLGKCNPEVAAPLAPQVFQTLLEIIRAPTPTFVTEQAIGAIGPLAVLTPEQFKPFYPEASQEMKKILFDQAAGQSHELSAFRGMALECWVLFGQAIGKELFMNDAVELLNIIAREHQNGLDFSDPFVTYMMQCCARIAHILVEDFVPYIDQFLPPLLEHVGQQLDVEVLTEEDAATKRAAEEEQEGVEVFEHYERGIGTVTFVVNSVAMQEKEVACRTLYQYVMDLKGHLGGYAEQIVRTVLPLLSWTATEGVRMVASWTAPRMFEVCLQCGLHNAKPHLRDLMKETITTLMKSVVVLRLGSPDTTMELLSITVDSLRELLRLCKEYRDAGFDMGLDAEFVHHLFELLRDTAAQIIHRQYLEVQPQRKAAAEYEEDVLTHLSDAIGWTIKATRSDCVPIFKETLEAFAIGMLEGAAVDATLQGFAICMLVDLIEYGGEQANDYVPTLLPHLFQVLDRYPEELAQTCVYAFGMLAQHGAAHFDSTTTKALSVLQKVLSDKRVPPPVRDNALAACLKFALFRSGQVDSAAILDAILPQYPLQADTFEARESHNLLINEFEASNPILFGDPMSNAPQLIRIFFSLLGQTESITDDSPEVWYEQIISLEDRARIAQDLIGFLQQADADFSNQCIAFANANGAPLPQCFQ